VAGWRVKESNYKSLFCFLFLQMSFIFSIEISPRHTGKPNNPWKPAIPPPPLIFVVFSLGHPKYSAATPKQQKQRWRVHFQPATTRHHRFLPAETD
jgi:hypothetical protein